MSRLHVLEAALVDHPDDAEAWAVYADWLESEGHPRGRLAVVQRQLADAPSDALREEEARLLEDPALAPTLALAKRQRWEIAAPARTRLTRLDLSLGTLSNAGARLLADAGPRAFPALTSLDVSENYLDETYVGDLRSAFPDVTCRADDQKTPDEYDDETYYYVSVGE